MHEFSWHILLHAIAPYSVSVLKKIEWRTFAKTCSVAFYMAFEVALCFDRYIDAINLLRQLLSTFISDRRRGYWTLRLSVDLEHLGRVDDSLQVAEDGLLDPWVRSGSRVALQRRVLRLGKPPRRWKIPSYSKSVNRRIFQVQAT